MYSVIRLVDKSGSGNVDRFQALKSILRSNEDGEIKNGICSYTLSDNSNTNEHMQALKVKVQDILKGLPRDDNFEFVLDIAIEPDDLKNKNLFSIVWDEEILEGLTSINSRLEITVYPG